MTNVRIFTIAILNPRGPNTGVVSRADGSSKEDAIAKAYARRQDFPDAEAIRVICSTNGIIASC